MRQVEITFTGVISVPAGMYADLDPEAWADKSLYYGTKHADIGAAVLEVTEVRELEEDE